MLVGAGGGFIIGPLLILVFGWENKMAVGTSLVCVSVASISGAISYLKLKIVDRKKDIIIRGGENISCIEATYSS